MKRKDNWKRISAWILTTAMVVSSSSFTTLAEELSETSVQNTAVQEAVAAEEPAVVEEMAETPVEVPQTEMQIVQETETEAETLAAPETVAETQMAETDTQLPEESETTTSEAEEIVIGDEGTEAETLPEDAEEAIEMALFANEGESEEVEYTYSLPLSDPGRNEILFGRSAYIENSIYYWASNGNGEWASVTNVEVLQECSWNDNGEEVVAQEGSIIELSGNAENGWNLYGNGAGVAYLQITWVDPDGETQTYGNLEDEKYCIYVHADMYGMSWQYPKGTNEMVPGETMEISLTLSHEHNAEDDYFLEPVENAKFVIAGQYDTSVVKASIDGSTLSITGVRTGDTEIAVNAQIPNESGVYETVASTNIVVNVLDQYMSIDPVSVENVKLGEEFDVNAQGLKVLSYSENNEQPVEVEDVRFRITSFESSVWEDVSESEDGNITALKRIGIETNFVRVAAEKKMEQADGEERWTIICERSFTFDYLDYDYGVEDANGDYRDWIYSNEDYTVSVNKDTFGELPVTVKWTVGQRNDWQIEEADSSAYTFNSDDSITLHGEKLAELYPEDNNFVLRVRLYFEGKEITGRDYDMHVDTPEYDYNFPATSPGDRDLIPGQNLWIDKWMSGYVADANYPDGEWLDGGFEVTKVEIVGQGTWDDAGNEITLEAGKEEGEYPVRLEKFENGWNICAQNYGWAKIQMTYKDANGEEQVYGADGEFCVYVHGEVYRLDFILPDDSNRLNYPGSLTAQTSLRLERDGEGSEAVDNYRLTLSTDDEGNYLYDTDALDVSITADGKGVEVKSKQRDFGEDIYIKVEVPDASELSGWREVCTARLDVEVVDSYYVVRFENMPKDGIQTQVGETLDIKALKPVIYECSAEHPEGVRVENNDNVRVTLIRSGNDELGWDENAWEAVEGAEDDLIPKLKRKESWGNGINVFVEERSLDENGEPETDGDGKEIWYESCRYNLQIPDLEYDAWFKNLREENYTWVFNDEDFTLALETKNLPAGEGKVTVEWQVGTWDEEGNLDFVDEENGYYTSNGNSITLHGKKLAEKYNGDNSGFNVNAIIKVNGIEVLQCGSGADVRESWYEFNYPLTGSWENVILLNESRDIAPTMTCYMEDKEHPYGENVPVTITKVEILGQYEDWDWENDNPGDAEPLDEAVITLTGNAQTGWKLQSNGNGYGFAHIQITYTNPKTGDEEKYSFAELVGGELYEFEWSYSDGTEIMQPNSEKVITTSLKRRYVDDDETIKEEIIKDYELSVQWDDGNDTYDTNLLTVTPEGTTLVIKSNDNEWETDIYVRAMIMDSVEPEMVEISGSNIHISVEKKTDDGDDDTPGDNNQGGSTINGLHKGSDGELYYYKNGRIDKEFVGLVKYNGEDYFVSNGKVTRLNGLNLIDATWYYLSDGKVDRSYTGLAPKYDEWFYVTDGVLDVTFSGIAEYNKGEFVIAAGRLVKEKNGLWQDAESGKWYFLSQGQIQRQYSGLALYDNEWFYVTNGVLNISYTGLVLYDGEWFYVNKGQMDKAFYGIVEYNGGKFIVASGRLVREANGLWQNPKDGEWYFAANGQIQTQYSGVAMYDGEWFVIENGKLDSDYNGTIEYDGAVFNVVAGQLYEQVR